MKIECNDENDTRRWYEGMKQHIDYFQGRRQNSNP